MLFCSQILFILPSCSYFTKTFSGGTFATSGLSSNCTLKKILILIRVFRWFSPHLSAFSFFYLIWTNRHKWGGIALQGCIRTTIYNTLEQMGHCFRKYSKQHIDAFCIFIHSLRVSITKVLSNSHIHQPRCVSHYPSCDTFIMQKLYILRSNEAFALSIKAMTHFNFLTRWMWNCSEVWERVQCD